MLTAESIQGMKQTNVSVNSDLTKVRTKEILKSAKRQQKEQIDALAGVNRVSINRVYSTGSISAKVAIAIAQVLNIDPAYLTGEAEDSGECTIDTLNSFLSAKGYSNLVLEPANPERKSRRKSAKKLQTEEPPTQAEEPSVAVAEEQTASVEEAVVVSEPEASTCDSHCLSAMTEEEAVQLVRALYLRAKYNGESGKILAQVQSLLV